MARTGNTGGRLIPGPQDENKATPKMYRRPAKFAQPDMKPGKIEGSKNYAKIKPVPDPWDAGEKAGRTGFGRTGKTGES